MIKLEDMVCVKHMKLVGLNLTKLTLFSHSFACICEDSGISCKGVRSLQIVFSQGSYCIFLPFFWSAVEIGADK